MSPKLKKIALAAAIVCAANALYTSTAFAGMDPCGGGCSTSASCTNTCTCFPMIGTPDPGVCTN
jgi:hypothetical protein